MPIVAGTVTVNQIDGTRTGSGWALSIYDARVTAPDFPTAPLEAVILLKTRLAERCVAFAEGSAEYLGDNGTPGPQGPQGSQGPTGGTGPQGSIGYTGDDGPEGPQGPSGSAGPQGAAGAAGGTGPQGPQGTTGSNGAQGAQGAAGSNGAQGPQGNAGSNGAQGAQGAAGAQGAQGANGVGKASLTANQAATNATTVLVGCTYTVPANTLAIGTVYRLVVPYRFVKTTSPPTLTIRLTIGGSVVATLVITSVSSATTSGGRIIGELTCITTGAGGTVMGSLMCVNDHGITSAVNWNAQAVQIATTAVDTTANKAIEIDAKMTTAVASNTLTLSQGYVELVKA